jgi:DHA3 family macrolide efflux protein-like MFS transporter
VFSNWRRNITLFLIAQALTLFGTMITGHAISWYVTLETQSGAVLTAFTVAMMVPMALASPFGGVWADRYNRKYLINIVDGAIALVTLAMALLFSVGIQWLGLLVFCAIVRGFGQGIQMPAGTALLADIVPPEELVRVNGFNAAIQSLSMFASPMIAAGLLTLFPIQILMYLDVVTAAIGITIVFLFVHTHKGMRRTTPRSVVAAGDAAAAPASGATAAAGGLAAAAPGEFVADAVTATGDVASGATAAAVAPAVAAAAQGELTAPAAAPEQAPGFFDDFKAGLRYMFSHRFILMLMIITVIFSIFATPPALLTPLQVTRNFGADVWRLGAVEVVYAVGMMAGGVIIGIWGGFKNRTYSMALATACFALGSIGLGVLGNFWVYLACMLFVGVVGPLFNAPCMAILQTRIDPDYMGRVFSVSMLAGSLAMPLGMLVFGPLADLISIDLLLVISGILMVPLAVAFLASRSLREAGKLPEAADEGAPQSPL